MSGGEDASLGDFGARDRDAIPPLVYRRAVVWSPTSPNKPAGFLGYDRRREVKVYTSRRKDYHYYRSGDGYAISDSILAKLDRAGVPRILLWAADTGDVFEYASHQYRKDAEPVPDHALLDEDDPQRYCPLDAAMNTWTDIGERLHVQPFDRAMDRLSGRSGW